MTKVREMLESVKGDTELDEARNIMSAKSQLKQTSYLKQKRKVNLQSKDNHKD